MEENICTDYLQIMFLHVQVNGNRTNTNCWHNDSVRKEKLNFEEKVTFWKTSNYLQLFLFQHFLKEINIENMFFVFLFSWSRNNPKSLGQLEKAAETLTCWPLLP